MPDRETVKNMFKSVASCYNFMNTAMTLGLDGLQRDALARDLAKTGARNVLDIACGSGVLSFAIAKAFEKENLPCHILGVDFCEELLKIAEHSLSRRKFNNVVIEFKNADALALPLSDECAEAVSIGFGIRNFESREAGYREILRVLKPGGHLFILETSQPSGFMRSIHFMWAGMVPALAQLVGSNPKAYQHLIDSSRSFPTAKNLSKELETAGFSKVSYKKLLGGTLALHQAQK